MKELEDDIGSVITIKGVLKPAMMCQGKPTKVVEIRKIEEIVPPPPEVIPEAKKQLLKALEDIKAGKVPTLDEE